MFKVGDKAVSGFNEVCTITEISDCGGYMMLERADGYTIGTSACLVKEYVEPVGKHAVRLYSALVAVGAALMSAMIVAVAATHSMF